jgi:hypothetical protein
VTPDQINFIKSLNLAFCDPPFAPNHDAVSTRCATLNERSEWIMEPAVTQLVQFKKREISLFACRKDANVVPTEAVSTSFCRKLKCIKMTEMSCAFS